MQAYQLTLVPQTAFGTRWCGDTLFGQICWAIIDLFGAATLHQCLEKYTAQQPFLVLSDVFPKGYIPLPTLPSSYWLQDDKTDRKVLKKRRWLPEDKLSLPSQQWQQNAVSDDDKDFKETYLITSTTQSHNSLNRQTNTTGAGGQFAPFDSEQVWYVSGSEWQLLVWLDEERLSIKQLWQALDYIGCMGYGRDASAGLGKFTVAKDMHISDLLTRQVSGNAVCTLAPSCPQGQGFDKEYSFYQVQTHFGRHGNTLATAGQPFKKPVLMAQTGAVFTTTQPLNQPYIGQGVGSISTIQPEAIHAGYAPVFAFNLDISALPVTNSDGGVNP